MPRKTTTSKNNVIKTDMEEEDYDMECALTDEKTAFIFKYANPFTFHNLL